MDEPPRIRIGACPVNRLSMAEAVALLRDALAGGRRLSVGGANAAIVVAAQRDRRLAAALAALDIVLPDGHWIQWAARLLGCGSTHHVPTVTLAFRMLRELEAKRGRVYLLGARPSIVRAATVELGRRFPSVESAGCRDGYFEVSDEATLVDEINAADPDLLLIGITSPKKEEFMVRNRPRLKASVVMGVGGLIDILGGHTREGPDWLRRVGFMWLYRLAVEPGRMWRRYTVGNVQFIWLVLREALRAWRARRRSRCEEESTLPEGRRRQVRS